MKTRSTTMERQRVQLGKWLRNLAPSVTVDGMIHRLEVCHLDIIDHRDMDSLLTLAVDERTLVMGETLAEIFDAMQRDRDTRELGVAHRYCVYAYRAGSLISPVKSEHDDRFPIVFGRTARAEFRALRNELKAAREEVDTMTLVASRYQNQLRKLRVKLARRELNLAERVPPKKQRRAGGKR